MPFILTLLFLLLGLPHDTSGHALSFCLFLQETSWSVLLSPQGLAMFIQPLGSLITNSHYSEMCLAAKQAHFPPLAWKSPEVKA